jgi:hypothetical protein
MDPRWISILDPSQTETLPSSPCRHVKKYAEQKRERFLNSAEIAELGRVLHEVEQDGSETKSAANAIRLTDAHRLPARRNHDAQMGTC